MSDALATAHKFEQFVSLHGEDPFVASTVAKMISTRLSKLRKELKTVEQTLARFERRYGKSSDTFLKEYLAGVAGDDMDFIEWSSLITMRERLSSERELLRA